MADRELNVIIVNDFGNINGGAAKVAVDSCVGLSKTDVNVYYFCATGKIDGTLLTANIKQIKHLDQDVVLTSKNKLKASVQGLWNNASEQAMNDMLKGFDVNTTIVHIHGWTKSLSVSCISAALKMGFNVVITLHDFFIYCPNGGFYNYPNKHICHKTPLSIGCIISNCDSRSYIYKVYRLVRSIIEKRVFRKFEGKINFIALSKLSYDVLAPYISRFRSTTLIENPIDTIKPAKTNIVNNNKIIYIGRLSDEKGVEYFCKAMQLLKNNNGVVIGEGPDIERLKQLYPFIDFMGWQSKSQISQMFKVTKALAFPSVCYETYGLVVQEAASYGIPAIVSDCTAACDFIIEGYNGMIFRSKDVADLANKINMIYTNNDFADKLSTNAYNTFWSKDHSLKRHSTSLIEYYQKILRYTE